MDGRTHVGSRRARPSRKAIEKANTKAGKGRRLESQTIINSRQNRKRRLRSQPSRSIIYIFIVRPRCIGVIARGGARTPRETCTAGVRVRAIARDSGTLVERQHSVSVLVFLLSRLYHYLIMFQQRAEPFTRSLCTDRTSVGNARAANVIGVDRKLIITWVNEEENVKGLTCFGPR